MRRKLYLAGVENAQNLDFYTTSNHSAYAIPRTSTLQFISSIGQCYVVPTAPAHEVMNLDPPACIHQVSRGPLKTFPTVDYALSRRVLLGMMMLFSSNDREAIPRQRESCYDRALS